MPGHDESLHDAAACLPLCAEPERLSASRPRLFGVAEFRFRAPPRRPIPAAHRGYRHRQMPARIRGRDLPGSRLARHRLGNAGAAAIKPSCGLSRGARQAGQSRAWSIRASKAAPRLPRWWRGGRRRRRGRAIPTGTPLYPGTAKSLAAEERGRLLQSGAPFALRLDMAAAARAPATSNGTSRAKGRTARPGTVAARPQAWGDVILARKETPTSYHLSVAIDDALQGMTDVVRGQDLFWSTSVHRLLQQLLGLPQPVFGIIGSFSMTPGASFRNRPRPRACANCARAARRRPTFAAWSGCPDDDLSQPQSCRPVRRPCG